MRSLKANPSVLSYNTPMGQSLTLMCPVNCRRRSQQQQWPISPPDLPAMLDIRSLTFENSCPCSKPFIGSQRQKTKIYTLQTFERRAPTSSLCSSSTDSVARLKQAKVTPAPGPLHLPSLCLEHSPSCPLWLDFLTLGLGLSTFLLPLQTWSFLIARLKWFLYRTRLLVLLLEIENVSET